MKVLNKNQMFNILPKKSRGFTLIELMVVIAIIAILSVVGITIFSGTQKSARDSRRRSDIDAISKALEVHYNTSANQYCTAGAGTYCAPVVGWFGSGVLPVDPQTGAQYTGLPANGATTYNVCATLETTPVTTFCKTQQQ